MDVRERAGWDGLTIPGHFFKDSGVFYLVRGLRVQIGMDRKKREMAREAIHEKALVLHPDEPYVKQAWELVLSDLQKLSDYCDKKEILFILVVFPYDFQFSGHGAQSDGTDKTLPQEILWRYSHDHQIKMLDLLPILSQKMKEQSIDCATLFMDNSHPSHTGSILIAGIIADYLLENGCISGSAN